MRGSPQGVSELSPTSRGSGRGSCTGKISHQNIWLWKLMGLTSGRSRGLWEIETLLKSAQNLTCSGTPGRSSNLKETWVRPTDWSWRASWRGRVVALTLGATNTGRSHLGGLFTPHGHWCWQEPCWILPVLPTSLAALVMGYSQLRRETAPGTSRAAALRPLSALLPQEGPDLSLNTEQAPAPGSAQPCSLPISAQPLLRSALGLGAQPT